MPTAKRFVRAGRRVPLRVVHGRPSYRLASDGVEAYVTEIGGHLGPVTFDRRGRKIAPFSVAPWANETLPEETPTIIRVLRGDFFCMPFGGNDTPYRGERHPVHGEPANGAWQFQSLARARGETTLHLSLRTRVRSGRVDKTITLRDGHPAVYCRHIVSEMAGPMPLGHHAMLKFPAAPGFGLISTSGFVFGQVFPGPFERAEHRGYSMLKPGAEFLSLKKAPTLIGGTTDLTRYPARRGYEDLVMLWADRSRPLAWTAVSFPEHRYVWFSLKDPSVLAGTVLWFSNGGRHYPPWSGRHIDVMGLEDVTSYFHFGLSESAKPNPASANGRPTSVTLDPGKPLTVSYVMACVPTPAGFDEVARITPDATGDSVVVKSKSGKSVAAPLDVRFLHGGVV